MTVEEELINCLRGVDNNIRRSIVFSNENYRLFCNIAVIARSPEVNSRSKIIIPFQEWLQSFLIEIRNNIKYQREIRKNIIDLIRARNEYERLNPRENSEVL